MIQYREGYANRFNGYTIAISDQSLGFGTICYKDTVPGYPPTYVEHDCSVMGRYVRYENNISHAELCNVEVYGCPVNYYGETCTLPCPMTSNCLTPPCNPDTGTCIGGCQSGYKGIMCDEDCQEKTFGQNCNENCSNCRDDGTCDHVTGICNNGCEDGWLGMHCNISCSSGYFGYDCLSQCNCDGTECDAVSGRCVSGTCLPGWTLPSCSQKCPTTTYGQNCAKQCGHCHGGVTCNHMTGICNNDCADGWLGMHCNISCSPGMYGFNCSEECGNCFNTSCNHVDGQCESCDFGYYGTKCDKPLVGKPPDTGGSQAAIPIVISCLILAVLAVIVVMVILRKRKQPNKNESVYMETITETDTHVYDERKFDGQYANSPNTCACGNQQNIPSVYANIPEWC